MKSNAKNNPLVLVVDVKGESGNYMYEQSYMWLSALPEDEQEFVRKSFDLDEHEPISLWDRIKNICR